ncbi:MAG: diaminopimelate epimerase [Pseudomonadota bacterium]
MREVDTNGIPFMKMHGLGNDFVVLDARASRLQVTTGLATALANRRTGIGFDQLALIEAGETDAHLRFWNADGSVSAACGNATRCIARYLMDETGKDHLTLTTGRGALEARDAGDGLTSVNMGVPQLAWDEIPLSEDVDPLELPIEGTPVATGMGNPHCTFFVEDAEIVALDAFGPRYETHPLFPERTNVQVASLLGPNRLRVRVWERGTGITLASGSSSCAVAVAAARRGLTGRCIDVVLDGGSLSVDWRDDGVWMTGPTRHVCDGRLTSEFLADVS